MSPKERATLIRLFIAHRKLLRAKQDNTIKQYANEMADAIADFLAEWSKPK